MFTAKYWHAFIAFILLGSAQATTVLVYPFASEDPRLGTAVANAVAESLKPAEGLELFGPAVAPTLVPPFVVDSGFYNPSGFYGDTAGRSISGMLQGASGADLVVNGHVNEVDGYYILELQLVQRAGSGTRTLQAPVSEPGVLADRAVHLIAHVLGLERTPPVLSIDPDGVDGVRALAIHRATLVGGLEAALETLARPELVADAQSARLRQAISAVLSGTDDGEPALLAALSLNTSSINEQRSLHYFDLLSHSTELPAVTLWQAMLHASSGDRDAAVAVLESAGSWPDYPYGRAVRDSLTGATAAAVRAALSSADAASLLVYSVLARVQEDTALEQAALRRLSRVDPWNTWAFERLSFIAFDEDEALDAAQALAVAVTLEPDSDLYWTNLGWSQYLLGLLEASEQSSVRATLLAPQQFIAHYNLGLVRTVTGRLQSAIEAYDAALRHDPLVEDAAIEDLQDALTRYPRAADVHYSLAYLLEAAGERSAAAGYYRSFLARVQDGPFAARAAVRLEQLSGPAPELQLPMGISLFLGSQPVAAGELQAGDPLRPSFEVYTPGEVLPTVLNVTIELNDEDGSSVVSRSSDVTLPPDTVGFVIDGFTLELPAELAAGAYLVSVTVTASEDRQVTSVLPVTVHAHNDPLRQVFGYGITLQSVETGGPLFDRSYLGRWPQTLAVLQNELNLAEAAADEVLPLISSGRFAGLSGGAAFSASTEADLRDFISYIAHPDLQGSSFVFVDTYAQWVLEGAPAD